MSSPLRYGLLANHSRLMRKLDMDAVMSFLIEEGLVTRKKGKSKSEMTEERRTNALLILIHRVAVSDGSVYERFLAILEDEYRSGGQQLKSLVTRIRSDAIKPEVVARFEPGSTRLNEKQKEALQREEHTLVDIMNVEDILPYLVNYGVLSLDDNEHVMGGGTFGERAQRLFGHMYDKSAQQFGRFALTLTKTDRYRESGKRLLTEGEVEEDVDMDGAGEQDDVSKSDTNLQDTFEKSDSLWQKLVQEYPDVLRENEEMQEIQKQLRNKEITLCVFGRHNCGKSTLLNALLENLCLPTNILNETGVHVKIQHDTSVHPGYCNPCQQGVCPRLSDGTHTAVGAEEIWDYLKKANIYHRRTRDPVNKEYTLYAHIPILKDVPEGWRLVLVDTPGFGEAQMDSITALATKLLNTSSAYLYIVDVNSIGDETDARNMRCIFDRDQKVFQDNRIVVAVSKYDGCLLKESAGPGSQKMMGNVPSLQELQQHICDQVKNSTGMECTPDIIVPVSAQWATQARMLKQYPSNTSLLKKVCDSLRMLPDPPMRGQEETADSTPSLTRASQLELLSRIQHLEKRLRTMIEHCLQSWVLGLATGYADHLSEVKARLEDQLRREQEESKDIQHVLCKHEQYKVALEEFIRKAFVGDRESQMERDLKVKFEKADMPRTQEDALRVISHHIQRFESELKAEIIERGPLFDEQSLQKSVNKFMKDVLEPELNTRLPEGRLVGVILKCGEYQPRIDEMVRHTEEAALAFLREGRIFHGDSLRSERVETIQERELLEARELRVSQLEFEGSPRIPRIKYSWGQWLFDHIMKYIKPKAEATPHRKWSEDIDKMIQELKDMLIEQTNRYIEQDFKNWIASNLARIHHTHMKKQVEAVYETFHSDVDRRVGELEERKAATDERFQKVSKDVAEIAKNLRLLKQVAASARQEI